MRKNEKEAKRLEKEQAKKLEKEQAKIEKLNRNRARSTERLAPRSGSLERRKSGEYSPVLNQSTVHGIASPNRRPTIFDVFRPRAKSDAKKRDNRSGPASVANSDRDNSSTGSGQSSGGIMQTMKTAMQNTGLIGHRQGSTVGKFRDGSAHPHQGSDAQVFIKYTYEFSDFVII